MTFQMADRFKTTLRISPWFKKMSANKALIEQVPGLVSSGQLAQRAAGAGQGGYGAMPQQAGYGAMPQQAGYGAMPQQAGYGAMPQQAGYGAMPQQAGYGAMPQ